MRQQSYCVLAAITAVVLARPAAAQNQNKIDQPPPLVAPTDARTPEDERKTFHLPPSFDIELVAAEPDIAKPMNLNFDDRGRLWVTSSVEYPFPAKDGTKPRDTVKVLSNFDEHGRARKVTTFADGLNIPIGVLPLGGGDEAIVHSSPSLWRLRDTDGDGRADERSVLFTGFGSQDTHGMVNGLTSGFDGWVYACHGFANTSNVRRPDGPVLVTMNSGNTFRFQPDGSKIEQFTHGQVNPFGLCFDPLGNLYSADCHSRPVTLLLRGGYYQSFGKPDDRLGFVPDICTHDHGSTAIAGIVYYAADHFPKEYEGTIFVGNVVTNRINHDRLDWHGSTPRCIEQPDFLKCDDPWFRPVDLKLGPDGALYVADFYNKIIGHYEVPLTHPGRDRDRGRIWRIVYRGADGKRKPIAPRADWTKATIDELVLDLAHPNLTVRMTATNQLVERGPGAITDARPEVFAKLMSPLPRAHSLWVFDRLGLPQAPRLVAALSDTNPLVRTHALRVLGEQSELTPDRRSIMDGRLADDDASVRRAAATVVAKHPSVPALRALLDARIHAADDDTLLVHAVRSALRDQLAADGAWPIARVVASNSLLRDAVADVATGVQSPDAALFLLDYLEHAVRPGPRADARPIVSDRPSGETADANASKIRPNWVQHIARVGDADSAPRLVRIARANRPTDLSQQLALLRAIDQGFAARGGRRPPTFGEWAVELAGKLLAAKDAGEMQAGIELTGQQKLRQFREPLNEIAARREAPLDHRRAALTALVSINSGDAAVPQIVELGRALRDPTEIVELREHAANLLAGQSQPEARAELVEALKIAPQRLQNPIASALANTKPGAEALLEACTIGKASPQVLTDRAVQLKLQRLGLPKFDERLAELTRGLPSLDQKIQALSDARRAGFVAARAAKKLDVEAGAKVYEKSCSICHQLGGKGAKVGPQLDAIGARGADRLIEDILDPNRNVDQAFRTTNLALANGRIVSGLFLREEGNVLVIADSKGQEQRVAKDDIDERSISPVSPMPANLTDQIAEPDFYHLLAFLLANRDGDSLAAPRK